MATHIKVDEDLSEDVTALLRSARFDVLSVREQNMSGKADDVLWKHIQMEGRFLITADKGFGQLARIATHYGLALLRPERESRVEYLRLTQKLIDSKLFDNPADTVIVVSSDRIRIRKNRKSHP